MNIATTSRTTDTATCPPTNTARPQRRRRPRAEVSLDLITAVRSVRVAWIAGTRPTRLVNVLNWIAEGPRVKVLFVNIFAGITDLGEFSRLLVEAFARVPALKIPIVARLVGTNVEAAREYLATRNVPVCSDLGEAVALVRRHLQ